MKLTNVFIVSVLAFVLFLPITNLETVKASNNESLPFMVEPILPDNQNEETNSYISITYDENKIAQTFEFLLTNKTDKEQSIKLEGLNAYASPSGVIQYVEDSLDNSTIINDKYMLSNYLEIEKNTVTLHPNEQKIIPIPFQTEEIEGALLGGIGFSVVNEGEEQEKEGNNFKINNKINMIIGVKVDFVTDTDVSFVVGEPYLDPMPSYYAIRLPIELTSPHLVKEALLKYRVFDKEKELFTGEKELDFAPYTKSNISIPYESEDIEKNNNYSITGTLTYKNVKGNEQSESFEGTFLLNEKENTKTKEANNLATPIVTKDSNDFWNILTWVTIPIIVLVFTYLIWRKKKRSIVESNN